MRWAPLTQVYEAPTSLMLAVTVACCLIPAPARARGLRRSGGGYHSVRPYITKRGTYVAPRYQTNPNDTKLDNWSTKGNLNPLTGKTGTKDPY